MEAGSPYLTYTWIVDTPATNNGPPNSGPPNSNPDDPNDNPDDNPDTGCSSDPEPPTPESCPSDGPDSGGPGTVPVGGGAGSAAALASAIGDLKIAYAIALGNAAIALATTKGNAAIAYQFGEDLAEQEKAAGNDPTSRDQIIHAAQRTYVIAVAKARNDDAAQEADAERNMLLSTGADAVTAAHDSAAAEAAYQQAITARNADDLAAIGESPTASPQQKFDAIYASALATWIVNVSPALIQRATDLASWSELSRPLKESGAGVMESVAEYAYTSTTAPLDEYKADQQAQIWSSYGANIALVMASRDEANVADQAALEVQQAIGQKSYAVTIAQADKAFGVAQANQPSAGAFDPQMGPADVRRVAIAVADFNHVQWNADAALSFEQQENSARLGDTEV